MSELQAYYDAFRMGYWADPDASVCPCHGSGWALSDVDTWHTCPIHYKGQSNPEDDDFGDHEPPEFIPTIVVRTTPVGYDDSDDEIPF